MHHLLLREKKLHMTGLNLNDTYCRDWNFINTEVSILLLIVTIIQITWGEMITW